MFSLNLLITRDHNDGSFSSEILSERACIEKLIKKCGLSIEEAKEKLPSEDMSWDDKVLNKSTVLSDDGLILT